MTSLNVTALIQLYFDGDRTAIRKQYEDLFGVCEDEATDEPKPADADEQEAEEPDAPASGSQDDSSDHDYFVALAEELPSAIGEPLLTRWEELAARSRPIAYHYFVGLLDAANGGRDLSVTHCQEGLLLYFDVEIVSHLSHHLEPNYAFPIGENIPGGMSFQRLSAVLSLFGIEPEFTQETSQAEALWAITDAVDAFREANELEDWQMWALVYDLGPRLLPAERPYPADRPPRVWVVATHDQFGEFEIIDAHGPENVGSWAINPKARRGDIAVMYCVAPRSAITSIYRCASDAYYDPFGGWNGYRAELKDKVAVPWITYRELRDDLVIGDWKLVRSRFQGLLKHEMPENVWRRFAEIVAERDARAGDLLRQYVGAAEGVRSIRAIEDRWTEAAFENQVVIPLLESLGWKSGKTLGRQIELLVKIGSGRPHRVYADFVGYTDAMTSIVSLVVEVKRRIGSQRDLEMAVEQAESYAGKLRCHRFAVISPEAVRVYRLHFPMQSEQLLALENTEHLARSDVERLRELIAPEPAT